MTLAIETAGEPPAAVENNIITEKTRVIARGAERHEARARPQAGIFAAHRGKVGGQVDIVRQHIIAAKVAGVDQLQLVAVSDHRRPAAGGRGRHFPGKSEEHTSELQSLMRISYAVFCLKKNKTS